MKMEALKREFVEGMFRKLDELQETLQDQFQEDLRVLRDESANTRRQIEDILRRLDSPKRHDDSPETVVLSGYESTRVSAEVHRESAGQTDCLYQWPPSTQEELIDSGVASGFTVGPNTGAFSRRSLHGARNDFPRHNLHTINEVSAVSTSAEAHSNWGRESMSQAEAGSQTCTKRATYDAATGECIWTSEDQGEEVGQVRLNRTESMLFSHIPSDQPLSTTTQLPDLEECQLSFTRDYTCPVVSRGHEFVASTRPIPAPRSVWSYIALCAEPGERSVVDHPEARPVERLSQPMTIPRVVDTQQFPRNSTNSDRGICRLKVDNYDGKQPLEDYLLQFDVIAAALRWDTQQRTTMLAASLREQALAVFSNMKPEHRSDWTRLVNALRLRFGRGHLRELAQVELKMRRQQAKEDLAAFAEDVRRLVRRAFPECPLLAQNRIAIQQFVDGIGDLEVQDWVRMTRPDTLDSAVVFAMECETSRRATRFNRSDSRAVKGDSSGKNRNSSASESDGRDRRRSSNRRFSYEEPEVRPLE